MMFNSLLVFLIPGIIWGASLEFTYLDLIDSSIQFDPVMYTNWVVRSEVSYSIFTRDEQNPSPIPGYLGKRCIIEVEMAKALSRIQQRLLPIGLSLKVYDAYRPQQAVDYFTAWTTWADTRIVKQYHYPSVDKTHFDALSYLSRTSSHTKGTAVDVTICRIGERQAQIPEDFLGIWDSESLDMGVGYLCFDDRSHDNYLNLTQDQIDHRQLLKMVMLEEGFVPLDTEFWHFYYHTERNPDHFYNFPVRDDYSVQEGRIMFSSED